MLAGVLVLAAGAAEAQNRPAAKDDQGKDVKSSHAPASKPATGSQRGGKTASRDDADQSDMIMLQEPFRASPAMPVNVTRGR
jgi:hypothetical protein